MKPVLSERILFVLLTLLAIAGCRKTSCKTDKPVSPMPIAGNYFLQWQKLLGGSQSEFAHLSAVSPVITPDGGFVVAGATTSNDGDVSGNHGSSDVWVVKVNEKGSLIWQKTYGGSADDIPTAITVTADGGFVIVGATTSNDGDISGHHEDYDIWIIKIDNNGTLLWQRTLGGSHSDMAYAVTATLNGEIVAAGTTASNDHDISGNHGHYDAWLAGLDQNGNIKWQKLMGGMSEDGATTVLATPDGGLLMAGYTGSSDGDVSGSHGNFDGWVIKLDGNRNVLWQRVLGGIADDRVSDAVLTTDGGVVLTGITTSNDGDFNGNRGLSDVWVIKMDMLGNTQWKKLLGGSADDLASKAVQLTDRSFIITGSTASNDGDASGNHGGVDVWVVNLDDHGNKKWQRTLGGTGDDELGGITAAPDGALVISAHTFSNDGELNGNHGQNDIWLMKWRL